MHRKMTRLPSFLRARGGLIDGWAFGGVLSFINYGVRSDIVHTAPKRLGEIAAHDSTQPNTACVHGERNSRAWRMMRDVRGLCDTSCI